METSNLVFKNKNVSKRSNNFLKTFFILFILFLLQHFQAAADDSGGGGSRPWLLSQGAAAREAKRFTLQSWLENKDRRALMDMWLTINTPSPYEFILGLSMYHYTLDTKNGNLTSSNFYNRNLLDVSAYSKFVGLTAEYSNNTDEAFNDVTGIFNLRIFGNTTQGSHITLHYGLRTRTAENKSYRLNQQFPGVTLQIYLMKYLGIQGNYRYYMPYTESYFGDTQGDDLNAGVFVEYGVLRIFGDWVQERQSSKLNTIETLYNRTGNRIGLRFFF